MSSDLQSKRVVAPFTPPMDQSDIPPAKFSASICGDWTESGIEFISPYVFLKFKYITLIPLLSTVKRFDQIASWFMRKFIDSFSTVIKSYCNTEYFEKENQSNVFEFWEHKKWYVLLFQDHSETSDLHCTSLEMSDVKLFGKGYLRS